VAKVYENHAILQSVGKRIRKARERRGWTQEQIAARVGLSSSYYAGIERGIHNASLLTLASIAEALDLKVKSFIGSD